MPSTSEQTIGVAVDGAGKLVRNLELTVLRNDGTLATVEMQVVSIADPEGHLLDFGAIEALLRRIIDEQEKTNFFLASIAGG